MSSVRVHLVIREQMYGMCDRPHACSTNMLITNKHVEKCLFAKGLQISALSTSIFSDQMHAGCTVYIHIGGGLEGCHYV